MFSWPGAVQVNVLGLLSEIGWSGVSFTIITTKIKMVDIYGIKIIKKPNPFQCANFRSSLVDIGNNINKKFL